jgi:hypothetical protein
MYLGYPPVICCDYHFPRGYMYLVVYVINFGVLDKRTAVVAKSAKEERRRKNTSKLMIQTTSGLYH